MRGSALITVLVAAFCISILIALGYGIVQESIRSTRIELSLKGQAYNIAASGISEALSWYRTRRAQPVRKFQPKVSADALSGEEGLIRSFPVSEGARLWGRFVIKPEMVEDISDLRGRGRKGDGVAWRVRSQGILFINRDPALPFMQKPNEVVHRMTLMTEFQRLNVNPPVGAAILAQRGDQVEVLEGGRIRGLEGAAIAFLQNSGQPSLSVATEVTSGRSHRLATAKAEAYSLQVQRIFGVSWRELQELSDLFVDHPQLLPPDLPKMGIVFIEGDAVFDHKRPLNGGGILIVGGNLEIAPNSNSSFGGLIYCKGNFTMDSPALVSGTVIALGHVRLQGFGDFAEVQYNADLLNFVRQRLGQYRQTQALIQVRN